jgi:polysaccharide biosynthesis protein PelB
MLSVGAAISSPVKWRVEVQRPRLITPLSLVGLLAAVVIVLVLLYPQQRVAEQIRINKKVDEVSLQYIKSLLATEPDNSELRIQLAYAYASVGQFENALTSLRMFNAHQDPRWREEALMARLDILSKFTFASDANSNEYHQKLLQLKKELHASEKEIFLVNTLSRFTLLAEIAGEFPLAERSASRLVLATNKLTDFELAARMSLVNGHYLASAQYLWQARDISTSVEKKIKYLKRTIATLQAGGLGETALAWVKQLPMSDWRHADVLYPLIKLAMATMHQEDAAYFAAKLVGVEDAIEFSAAITTDELEIAYKAFLGNGELQHALMLAQRSVRRFPAQPLWRERVAQVAVWSNQPKIALEQWRWLSIQRGTDKDWKNWMKLATDLFDYEAQIIGLEREWRQKKNDEQYARRIISLYDYLGEPESALAWLERNGDVSKHPELMILAAELLSNMGRDDEARARYRQYLLHHQASPKQAVTYSGLLQRVGQNQEAFDVLMHSQAQAQLDNKIYWNQLGELAWILKRDDIALHAYQNLSNVPNAAEHHKMRLLHVLKMGSPIKSAETAEQFWLKNGQIEYFIYAVETYVALKDWQAVQHLYLLSEQSTTRGYETNLKYVALRAEMYKQAGNYAAAEKDFRLLAANFPDDLAIKEAYLWLLIEAHQLSQLDVLLQRWSSLLPRAPNLWNVFAAAHLLLNRPDRALIIYERMEKSYIHDDLWLLNYAATLDRVGQTRRGAQIRKKIWKKNSAQKIEGEWLKTRANASDIEALRLLLLNDPILGQGVLWMLLRDGSAELKQYSPFVELAARWLNDHEQNDASRTWLIRQYAQSLNSSP